MTDQHVFFIHVLYACTNMRAHSSKIYTYSMPNLNNRVKKARSQLQQEHTQSLSQYRANSQRIEYPESNPLACTPDRPSLGAIKIIKQKDNKIKTLTKDYKRLAQRDKRAKIERLQAQADLACERLQEQVTERSWSLVVTSLELESQLDRVRALEARQKTADCRRDAMRKKIARAKASKEEYKHKNELPSTEMVHEYHLKGPARVISPETRDMIRKLACQGVSTERISEVINIVAEGLGTRVVGSVSARSTAQIMLEGLVQARMQVAPELGRTNSFTICSDGTTIKNQQHEAKSIYMRLPVQLTNINDDKAQDNSCLPVHRIFGVHKAPSHTAQQQFSGWITTIDACCDAFVRSPLGMGSYISSKLVAPKLRGVLTDHAADQKHFLELITLWKRNCDRKIRAVPKLKSMTTEEQLYTLSNHLDSATRNLALAIQIGKAEFQKLSPEMQFDIDFLAWIGCCMHKELNSVKGGVTEMASAWAMLVLDSPIALRNKFEAINSSKLGDDKGTRGAIKLASLAGALFNNKDDKKGYQTSVDYFLEKTFGYSKRFPDTSNTRYGSYCDAATELIAIGKPYMRHVRSTGHNALQLGPFHDQLPSLQPIMVAFFNGALETWERFTTEFAADTVIAQATESQRENTWISPTNDVSEGALGQCRQMLRWAPTMTDEQRNARVMWGHNGTYNWTKDTLTEADHQIVRQEARLIDASGISQKARIEVTMVLEERAELGRARQAKALERKSANTRRLEGIDIFENATYDELLRLKIRELDNQIDKLRETDKSIRVKSKLRNKHAKVMEILDGLERRKELKGISDSIKDDLEAGSAGIDVFGEGGNLSEDQEMLFNDEVLL
ncbi:hypothetical protein BDV93DRAFT_513596 [Ceratobasidium sp. AG-I]|nr:hypothetical protein BDV93DRAFT_513596 [Ceratobasidium sp. AG-I]